MNHISELLPAAVNAIPITHKDYQAFVELRRVLSKELSKSFKCRRCNAFHKGSAKCASEVRV